MDDTHRLILQQYRRKLADDIIVTDRFLAQLVEEGIFESGMVHIIKAEKTESDQTYKLLDLLPKRGPEAFGKFASVLEEDYPWLAEMLIRAEPAQDRGHNGTAFTDTLHKDETHRQVGGCDPDIKKIVGTFVHRQFGQSRRISEKDKKSIEKFLADQLQQDRGRYQATLTPSTPGSVDLSCMQDEEDVFRCSEVQEHLVRMYIRLDVPLCDDEDEPSRQDQLLPDDLSFEDIYAKLDKLVEKVRGLDGEMARCLSCFEPHKQNASLSDLVADMRATNLKHQKEAKVKDEQVDKLLREVHGYSDHIGRLENDRQNYLLQLAKLRHENSGQRQENAALLGKISQLEKINNQKEQEKTLDVAVQAAHNPVSSKAGQEPPTDAGLKRQALRRSNFPASYNYRRQPQTRNAPKKRGRASFNAHASSKYY